MPGVGDYDIFLKKKPVGAFIVIKDQNGSEPRKRISVQMCNVLDFLNELHHVSTLFEFFEYWSLSDRMGSDFDHVSYRIMDGQNGKRYHFETFVEEYVPYLVINYIYKDRNDCLHFDARYLQELTTVIRNFAIEYSNLMVYVVNYNSSEYCSELAIFYLDILDSLLNKPSRELIVSWDDDEYNSDNEESNERPRGEVVKTLWVKVPIVNTKHFRWYCLEKMEGDPNFLIITEWVMGRINTTICIPLYTEKDIEYAFQYCDNLFAEVYSDRSAYDRPIYRQ